MGAAGLTQGGFYNQFLSKDDLAVQACERVLTDSVDKLTQAVEADSDPLTMLIKGYLSPAHRDTIGEGCIFPSLGSDAARHGPEMIRAFEAGVKSYLGVIEQAIRVSAPSVDNIDPIPFLSTMVGALLLSRLVQDEALSRRILKSATNSLLKYAPPSAATRKKKECSKMTRLECPLRCFNFRSIPHYSGQPASSEYPRRFMSTGATSYFRVQLKRCPLAVGDSIGAITPGEMPRR